MNRLGLICRCMRENPYASQREISQKTGFSLGTVNALIKECMQRHLIAHGKSIAGTYELTSAGDEFLDSFQVDGALIIAAGFGSRFVPLTFETPKGLLEVFGERMIERQIRQLHEVGIRDITIAVGYLKEKFEYLIDKYQVKLLYNPEYSCKNTLATIYRARNVLEGRNMYVLSSDNWMRENMFHSHECGPWYSSIYMEGDTSEWVLSYNKKGQITQIQIGGKDSWVMYGPVFFSKAFSKQFLPLLEQAYQTPGTEQFYWEHVLMQHLDELKIFINRQPADQVYEFENLEELRRFDIRYQNHSNNQAMELISRVFSIPESEIRSIRCLKSGMTNKSFLFQVKNESYICRIPGPGTEYLINRRQEASVYQAIEPLDLSERVIYLNGENGYKISVYYPDSRMGRADSWEDLSACMKAVKRLHTSGLSVSHRFDIRERIEFYERLCLEHHAVLFEDLAQVKQRMLLLMDRLDALDRPQTIAHIDANVDNFLFLPNGQLKLIDWEYAGMCDPLIDISMCAIYSYLDEPSIDRLLELYLERPATETESLVVYSYVALGGFLWSLWALYKASLGEEFGEYTLIMYRYAKRYEQKAADIKFIGL